MKIEVLSEGKGILRIKIFNEDFTLGNIIQEGLIKDERVDGAGVVEMHPLDRSISLQLYIREGKPKEILLQDTDNVMRELEEIKRGVKEVLASRDEG